MRIPRGAQALDQLARNKQRKQTLHHSPSVAINDADGNKRLTGEFAAHDDGDIQNHIGGAGLANGSTVIN